MQPTRLVALLAVLALLLAACETDGTGEGADPSPTATSGTPTDGEVDEAVLDSIADAVGNTVDEGTARFTITASTAQAGTATPGTETPTDGLGTETPTDGLGTETPTDGLGTETPTDGLGTETPTDGDSSAQEQLRVEGEVDFDAEQREFQFLGPQGQLTAIVDGDDLYVQLPATEEGEWARIRLDELAGEDIGFGGPAGIPFQNPQRTLELLREAAIEARELDGTTDGLGTETPTPTETDGLATETPTPTETDELGTETPTPTETDGLGTETPTPTETDELATETPTDDGTVEGANARYLVVVDLERAADLGTGEARQFQAMAERYGIDTLRMELWTDAQARIEQVAYTLPLSQARVEDGTEEGVEADVEGEDDLVVSVRYHEFGSDVTITVPDEDEVVDLDESELRQMLPRDGTTGGATASPTPTAMPSPTTTD